MSSKTEFRVELIITSLNLYHQLVQTEAALFTCCISLSCQLAALRFVLETMWRKPAGKFGLIKLGTIFSLAK
jgi:hypothetical protein